MTLFSPRCEYTVPGLLLVHVCVRVSDFSSFLPPPLLLFIDSVCCRCSAHFSFTPSVRPVSHVLKGDAENFIADT